MEEQTTPEVPVVEDEAEVTKPEHEKQEETKEENEEEEKDEGIPEEPLDAPAEEKKQEPSVQAFEPLQEPSESLPNLDEESDEEQAEQEQEKEEKPFSYFDALDAPRELPEPIDLTEEELRDIIHRLGLIKLCWPKLRFPSFDDRKNFPDSYLGNDDKEKVLLLYAENFRQQFCYLYPDRRPLLLACENECGIQKMVSTTLRPTSLPYPQLEHWDNCAKFVSDHITYEPLEDPPTLMPRRLCSPHTTIIRQKGHCFEIATVLCSLLIGAGYDAFVVSGYAIKDVTLRILTRIDPPYLPPPEKVEVMEEVVTEQKYKLPPQKELKSKFLQMMEQRKIDEEKAEQERLEEQSRLRILDEEKRPPDELEGRRIHAWILVLSGPKSIDTPFFIEPCYGLSAQLDSDFYYGVESVWNHENYWVNMQTCPMKDMQYDLTDTDKWEHLLIGEPLRWRRVDPKEMEEEETAGVYDEKHLDMPVSWSIKISLPNSVFEQRFPQGMKVTQYKRTLVEEYAPYVSGDGLAMKVTRFHDFDCTLAHTIEEVYENRRDKLRRVVKDLYEHINTEYFDPGRDDAVIKHTYRGKVDDFDSVEAERTIVFNSKARFDSLSKLEYCNDILKEYYENKENRLSYREVRYEKNVNSSMPEMSSLRKIFALVIEKFDRDESKPSNEDIALREFAFLKKVINLRFHYGKGKVTASTRTFIKPQISEIGEEMTFKPELTFGYQAELGAKPPSNLQLFLMFEEQLREERNVIEAIRERERQFQDFLLQRNVELTFPKLVVSMYNKEHNEEFKNGMLEREAQKSRIKVKEVQEYLDYMSPYLAMLGDPQVLTKEQALKAKTSCLSDFKHMMLARALVVQKRFESTTTEIEDMRTEYAINHEKLSPFEDAQYFENVNERLFHLKTLEIQLTRSKELSCLRYQALLKFLNSHPKLQVLKD